MLLQQQEEQKQKYAEQQRLQEFISLKRLMYLISILMDHSDVMTII